MSKEFNKRITYSRISAMAKCPRRHYWAYELGIRPREDSRALQIGIAFHTGLEAYKQGERANDVIRAGLAQFDTCDVGLSEEQKEKWRVDREMLASLLSGYNWRWAHMDQELEVVKSEQTFQIPLINPKSGVASRTFVLAGKLDAIVKLPDGRLAVMEHKTASDSLDADSDYWRRLLIDFQITLYWIAARELGYHVETVYYDVARKPGIKPLSVPLLDNDGCKIVEDEMGLRVYNKDTKPRQSASKKDGWILKTRKETPEEYGERLRQDMGNRAGYYYARREIPRIQADLDEAKWDLYHWASSIRTCQLERRWPRAAGACIGFGKCPYFDLCTSGYNPDTAMLPEQFEILEDVHPELA